MLHTFCCALLVLVWSTVDSLAFDAATLVDNQPAERAVAADSLLDERWIPVDEIRTDVDRDAMLSELFALVATGSTDEERVESWVRYLQQRIAHPKKAPQHDASIMVLDPLWILENRLGQCGQTNRVLVDGLLAAGFRARLVQLVGHVGAEVWLGGQWRYLDADWLSDGQFVRRADGTIPSARAIADDISILLSIDENSEFRRYEGDVGHAGYPPYETAFQRGIIGEFTTPFYYTKTSSAEHAAANPVFFGWDSIATSQE